MEQHATTIYDSCCNSWALRPRTQCYTFCDIARPTAHQQLQLCHQPPVSTVTPAQCFQNTSAILSVVFMNRAHITPALKKLHWLPVHHHIPSKSLVWWPYTAPVLSDMCLLSTAFHQRWFRQKLSSMLPPGLPRTKLGNHAFSATGVWNSLPLSLWLTDSYREFCRQLNTYLFKKAFDCHYPQILLCAILLITLMSQCTTNLHMVWYISYDSIIWYW